MPIAQNNNCPFFGLYKSFIMLTFSRIQYRFIRAMNAAPLTLQYLDDAFEGGDAWKLQIVHTTVREYEQKLRQNSDNIIRAETKKAEEVR